MTFGAWVLFVMYAMEIAVLVIAMSYVMVLWLKKKTKVNPMLTGNRLKVAATLPLLWFIYVFSDAYEVYTVCERMNWNVNESSLQWKAARQGISMVGSVITALLFAGTDFMENQ